MTHRERVRATLAFQPTDRLPYDLMEGTVWEELFAYFRTARGLTDPEQLPDFLDTDFRWLFRPPGDTPGKDARRERSSLTFEVAHGPLAGATTVAEVERHRWPDPTRWLPPDAKGARQRWPDHCLVLLPGWSPLFWGVCDAFGVEQALVNLHQAPALFECAARCIHERYMERLGRLLPAARGYCDLCWLADDFAGQQGMLISPEHWRRHIKPLLAEQVAFVHRHGLSVIYHSCGAVRPVIGDLIDIGVSCHLVFQTKARGMDPESIAREFGGRMAFYGGMDVQHLLSFGTAEEVRQEVLRNAAAFERCGGYIVANSHTSFATINGKNVEVMCETARGLRGKGAI